MYLEYPLDFIKQYASDISQMKASSTLCLEDRPMQLVNKIPDQSPQVAFPFWSVFSKANSNHKSALKPTSIPIFLGSNHHFPSLSHLFLCSMSSWNGGLTSVRRYPQIIKKNKIHQRNQPAMAVAPLMETPRPKPRHGTGHQGLQ